MTKEDFDTVYSAKLIKSRKGFMIWVPVKEAEYLDLSEKELIRVGIKKVKK